jgi:hypothetical protein
MMRSQTLELLFLTVICLLHGSNSFLIPVSRTRKQSPSSYLYRDRATKRRSTDEEEEETKKVDPLTKAAWYATEAFGKAFGSAVSEQRSDSSLDALDEPPASIEETQSRIKRDNEREYFLSGRIDELIYDEQCTFADPFVSFRGRDRFVENLANLGSFISEYSAKPLEYAVSDNEVTTRFMVKLQLNLPWKPVLAWPWGVRCEIDPETNLIVRHEESVRRVV